MALVKEEYHLDGHAYGWGQSVSQTQFLVVFKAREFYDLSGKNEILKY